MRLPIFQVDAFSDRPFAGNPAGVCLLTEPAEPDWMRSVAAEMNLSETAFLRQIPVDDGVSDEPVRGWSLRWFTPVKEVRLCGHATLASAHILWETGRLNPGEMARFMTLSGMLTAVQAGGWIEMDFPARFEETAQPPVGLVEALGITPRYCGKLTDNTIYLFEVESEEIVRHLAPDFAALAHLPIRSVMVTARAETPGYDFVSRYFAPSVGINEDPVTGSAHCALAPYWAKQICKPELVAYQASPRGGELRIRVEGERVKLCGQAVTILAGELKTD